MERNSFSVFIDDILKNSDDFSVTLCNLGIFEIQKFSIV